MSKSSRTKNSADKQLDEHVSQFCSVTGASVKDAKRFLERHKRVDIAIDAYYNDPNALAATAQAKRQNEGSNSTSKLNALFDKYKEPDGDNITIDGTIKLCEDLGVNPEDVVLLAVAYELKSPNVGEWGRKGWVEGWKGLNYDTIPAMKSGLERLRQQLGSDSAYFQKVYNYTFDFARSEGQRSLATDTAQAFWALLIPAGLAGGALAHTPGDTDGDGDDTMETDGEGGWRDEYTEWWFEFLKEKGGKGVSKDTWAMFFDFVRTIDARFARYDTEAAWPSTIDDFVEWAKERLAA